MRQTALSIATAAALIAGCRRASEPVMLRVAPPVGEVHAFHTRIETSGQGFLGIEIKGDTWADWSLTRAAASDPENVTLAFRVLGASLGWGGPFGAHSPDSDATLSAADLTGPWTDGSIRLRLDSRGRLRLLEGLDSLLSGRPASGRTAASGQSVLGAIARGAAAGILQQAAAVFLQGIGFVPLPEAPVTPGTKWHESGEIVVPLIGKVTYDNEVEMVGIEEKQGSGRMHRFRQDLLLRGGFALPSAGGPSARIERGLGFGEVLLDTSGLPVSSDMKWQFTVAGSAQGAPDAAAPPQSITVTLEWRIVTTRIAGK